MPCPMLPLLQVYRAQHNETVYAVKVLTGMDGLVTAAAALSLSDPLLHKFEQVGAECSGVQGCSEPAAGCTHACHR